MTGTLADIPAAAAALDQALVASQQANTPVYAASKATPAQVRAAQSANTAVRAAAARLIADAQAAGTFDGPGLFDQ